MTRKPWHGQGSRHERGYGRDWTKARILALARDEHLCQPCLRAERWTPATQVDHVTPKAKGGTDDLGNLQAICRDCHDAKSAREAAEGQGRVLRPRVALTAAGWPEGSG